MGKVSRIENRCRRNSRFQAQSVSWPTSAPSRVCSSGNYINKTSYSGSGCRFDYKKRAAKTPARSQRCIGNFMDRHYELLKDNQRIKVPMKNLEKMRKQPDEMANAQERAAKLRMPGD